ncbi:MAG: GLUG motif-containing protein [Sedimentisphaerales bacterium]
MKKPILFLVMWATLLIPTGNTLAFSGSGSGTETNPYIITNVTQLQEMRYSLYAWYRLGNDIDASETQGWNSGEGFLPVGDGAHPFAGHLQGNGFKISGLYIYRVSTDYVGLFGKVAGNATIEDVTLTEPNMIARNYCGALAGYTDAAPVACQSLNSYIIGNDYVGGLLGQVTVDMNNCSSSLVEVQGHDRVGGLVGQSRSLISCNSSGLIRGNSYVGGLAGGVDILGPMENCNSSADITATGGSVGGLVGDREGNSGITITNSYATGSVRGTGENIGGLIGFNYYSISFCYSTGSVVSSSRNVGGLIGYAYSSGNISNCYSTGNVTSYGTYSADDPAPVGGLIGFCYGWCCNIIDCHASGNIYTNGCSGVGGLIGRFYYCGSIQRCYSAAQTVTGASRVGGLIGNNDGGAQISQCFSVSDVNGQGHYIGGLIGYNIGSISVCYVEGNIIGEEYDIGGLVGYNSSSITDCYVRGSVTGEEFVGGFVGENASSGNILRCYSTGAVNGLYNSGGFAAWNSGGCSYNYWDTETSGWPISACGNGRTTTQMMQQSTYEPEWDFEAVWGIDEGHDYPVLIILFFEPACGDPWHPYPVGDFNHDCKVDFADFATFSLHWLECTAPVCD